MNKIRKGFLCLDCGFDTLFHNEYYMVHNALWCTANPKIKGMLCVKCLEGRIGRQLRSTDFTDCSVNTDAEQTRSVLLQSRLID